MIEPLQEGDMLANPADTVWKEVDKWILENPTCSIVKDLGLLKELTRYQGNQMYQKRLDLMNQKLDKMFADWEKGGIQLLRDVKELKDTVNELCTRMAEVVEMLH